MKLRIKEVKVLYSLVLDKDNGETVHICDFTEDKYKDIVTMLGYFNVARLKNEENT